jgi:hypothetical protein
MFSTGLFMKGSVPLLSEFAKEIDWKFSPLTFFPDKKQLILTALMRCYMQVKPEFRKSERFGHESIISVCPKKAII